MLKLRPSSYADHRTLKFLEQNPVVSDSILAACDEDFNRISTLVGPILDGPQRHDITSYYLQAVVAGDTAFLTTNLFALDETLVTEVAPSWLIGRSRNCAITVHDPTISRCHAVVGFDPKQGFHIMDVGSNNGTFVDGQRLQVSQRYMLVDGDVIKLSDVSIEFFVVHVKKPVNDSNHLTEV
jgi:pSer/pThr/pTyr-binding forkhead associated (FHA) protein